MFVFKTVPEMSYIISRKFSASVSLNRTILVYTYLLERMLDNNIIQCQARDLNSGPSYSRVESNEKQGTGSSVCQAMGYICNL